MMRNRSKQTGVSLVEVMVAVLVLSIGLVGLGAFQGVSLQNNKSALLRTQATNLAYSIMDELRAERPAFLAAGTPPTTANQAAWDARAAALLPNGTVVVNPQPNAQNVRIDITWLDERTVGDTAGQQVTFSMDSKI